MAHFENRDVSSILEEGGQWVRDRDARRINLSAALAASDLVRTTLGPKGFDKLLVASDGTIVDTTDITSSNAIQCTNDGLTILEQANVNHPAPETLVEVARAQHAAVADGTTTAVIVAGELLRNAGELLEQGTHPVEIIRGYRRAAERAGEVIDELANADARLQAVAETSLAGTILDSNRRQLSELIAEAVHRVSTAEASESTTADWRVQVASPKRATGWVPQIAHCTILHREPVDGRMPSEVEGSVLLIESPLGTTATEAVVEKHVEGWEGYETLVNRDAEQAEARVDALAKADPDIILCGDVIDDPTANRLARNGVLAFECVPEDALARCRELFGKRPVSELADASEDSLVDGTVREEPGLNGFRIEPATGRPPVVTLVVPEPGVSDTYHNVPKRIAERTVTLVEQTAETGRVLPGGGAAEIEIAAGVRDQAAQVAGREQLAFEAFASAIEVVPRQLASSAGMRPTDVVLDLRREHRTGGTRTCVDVREKALKDGFDAGVVDSAKVKRQSVASAVEAVNRLLKIDTIIAEQSHAADGTEESGSDETIGI